MHGSQVPIGFGCSHARGQRSETVSCIQRDWLPGLRNEKERQLFSEGHLLVEFKDYQTTNRRE